jgi:hypothetical protein
VERGSEEGCGVCYLCGSIIVLFSFSVHGQCRLAAQRMKRIFHICDRGMLCRI